MELVVSTLRDVERSGRDIFYGAISAHPGIFSD
jgi:hypothetical protein